MLIVPFVIAGWAVIFMLFWRMLARHSARVRAEAQQQIEGLSARVADLEQTIAIAHALRSPETDAKSAAAVVALAILIGTGKEFLAPAWPPITVPMASFQALW